MIRLRRDCLVFKTPAGEQVPCSAHEVTLELIGQSGDWFDKDVLHHAAEAVLHYFKVEKGQENVSLEEFTTALDRALRWLGLEVKTIQSTGPLKSGTASTSPRLIETDLWQLATESNHGWELCFFPRLREELRRPLDGSPLLFRFRGLRACVKLLAGARRWSPHCQSLNDHIVDYLRSCLCLEKDGNGCSLVVI